MSLKTIRYRNTATRLIRDNGAIFQMRRTTDDVVDDDLGTVEPGEVQTQDVIAVILPTGSDTDAQMFLARNSNLTLTDSRKILIANQGLLWDPMPLEEFLFRGEWWVYDPNSTIDPEGDVKVLFKGYIRKR